MADVTKATFFQPAFAPAAHMDLVLPRVNQHEDIVQQVIETADDALQKKFVFNMEWDLERTDIPVIFKDKINWEFKPADDNEFIWAFNRHQFLVCLAQAYLITGKEKYVQGYIDLITDFIDQQPISPDNRMTTWRILEIGFRTEKWLKSLYMIQDSPKLTDAVLNKIYASMRVHEKTLLAENKPYNYSTNWGVFENFGLFLYGCLLPHNSDTERALHDSLAYLSHELHVQVQNDGVQVEQSALYHNEVLRVMLEVILFARRLNLTLPAGFSAQVAKMAKASRYMAKPDGTQLLYGDSDVQHLNTPWQLAAIDFADGTFKQASDEPLSFENSWLFTAHDQALFDGLAPRDPEQTSIALESSGHYVLRSSWRRDANMLHMDCGQIGSGHGHSDLLHVDWIVGGHDVLVDAGRYTYVDKADRYEFKMLPAHNTIIVDGFDPHHYDQSWDLNTQVDVLKSPLHQGPGYEFFEGGHDGFMKLPSPVWVTRKVLHLQPDIYLVIDQVKASGKHHYQQAFHYDSQGKVVLNDHVAEFTVADVAATSVFDERLSSTLADSEQSYHYNSKVASQQVVCAGDFTGNQTFYTVLVAGAAQNVSVKRVPVHDVKLNRVVPEDEVEGLDIVAHSQHYLVINGHGNITHGTNLYRVGEHYTEAKLTFFDLNDPEDAGTMVSW
ncbi:alginate lyase family protein [Lacticaseibacillus sp. GG6-2]